MTIKPTIADYAEGEDSTENTHHNPEQSYPYHYYGPPPQQYPESTNQPNIRPPIRRQTEVLEGVLGPIKDILGPDAGVMRIVKLILYQNCMLI